MHRETKFRGCDIVAFDIETTGLTAGDTLTTITALHDSEYSIWINVSDSQDVNYDHLENELTTRSGVDSERVTLYMADSEESILESFTNFTDNLNVSEVYPVAYNGEVWNGGFDLSFLRTLMFKYDMETQPFEDLWYIDLYPIFDKGRINTTAPSINDRDFTNSDLHQFEKYVRDEPFTSLTSLERHEYTFQDIRNFYGECQEILDISHLPTKQFTDLVNVHRVLMVEVQEMDENEYRSANFDPFSDSHEAVTAYENGEYADLILHNMADVKKTFELSGFLNYIPDSDVEMKKLEKSTWD